VRLHAGIGYVTPDDEASPGWLVGGDPGQSGGGEPAAAGLAGSAPAGSSRTGPRLPPPRPHQASDRPHFVSRHFKPACTSVGLPAVRFHYLRHLNASLLFDERLSGKRAAAARPPLSHRHPCGRTPTCSRRTRTPASGRSAQRAAAQGGQTNVLPLRAVGA